MKRCHVVQVLVIITVALVIAAVAWQRRHPSRSFEANYGLETDVRVGVTRWMSLEHGSSADPGEIGIRSIEPRMVSEAASASVEYVVCELDPAVLAADKVSGSTMGGRDRDTERYCITTVPAEGAALILETTPGYELLVGVTATRSGRVVIEGHTISFSEGWQIGTEEIAVETVLIARRSAG